MEQLPEGLIGPGLLIIKSVCSDYDYLTVTTVFICIHFLGRLVWLHVRVYIYIYIYIRAEAARLRRASTARRPVKRNTHHGIPTDGASTITLCEPCTEVRILSP